MIFQTFTASSFHAVVQESQIYFSRHFGVPKNLTDKLANPFCKALTEQISSETNWPQPSLDSLTDITQDARLQSADQFYYCVLTITTHNSKELER